MKKTDLGWIGVTILGTFYGLEVTQENNPHTHFELGFSVRLNCHDGKEGGGAVR